MTYGPTRLAVDLVTDWRRRAACTGLPNSAFFPVDAADTATIAQAKTVCETCPVSAQCLEYAFETNQRAGIWGGTTEDERRSLRRKWLTTRRRSA